jgi:uncharacterized OB-fold protein
MGALPADWSLPELTDLNREWFTSGTLAVQHCPSCDVLQHPPEELCHRCGRTALGTRVLAPTGTVHSFTVVRYAAHRRLTEALPYTVVLVALDDAPDVRVLGNIDCPAEAVRIGLRVEAYWESRTASDGEEILLPQWRPTS